MIDSPVNADSVPCCCKFPPLDYRRPAKRGKRRTGGGGAAADAKKRWDVSVPFGGSLVQVGSRADAETTESGNTQPFSWLTYKESRQKVLAAYWIFATCLSTLSSRAGNL